MDDYLELIKNAKRKSSNPPVTPPANHSRTSSPFPNTTTPTIPSPDLPYVNHLGKLKAVDLKSWGSPAPKDPSPSKTFKYLNDAPRINAGGLPNPHSIPPTTNLFGDIVPNPKPSGGFPLGKSPSRDEGLYNREKSIRDWDNKRSNTLGTMHHTPSRLTTNLFAENVNKNTPMFGGAFPTPSTTITKRSSNIANTSSTNSSYYGEGGSFDNKNNITRRSDDNNLHRPARSPMGRDSKDGRDISPTFGVKKEGRKRSSSRSGSSKGKVQFSVIVLGIMLLVLVGVVIKVITTTEQVTYCNSDLSEYGIVEKGCEPCPEFGHCQDGKLIACEDKYKRYKDKCVWDYEKLAMFSQYRKYINSQLAYLKGEKLCNKEIQDAMTLSEIKNIIQARFGKDSDFQAHRFEERWNDYFEEEEGLVYNSRTGLYYTSDDGNPSLSCKFRLLWREGKLVGLWIFLFVASVFVAVRLIRRYVIYSRLGKEMYEDVKEYLMHFKNVSVKTLKKEFQYKYPGKNFERIWSYVESHRKQEAKIFHYFDTYQGVQQEFWLRTH